TFRTSNSTVCPNLYYPVPRITQVLQSAFPSHDNFPRLANHLTRGIMSFLENDKTFSRPVIWGVTAFFIALHILAVAALFLSCFSYFCVRCPLFLFLESSHPRGRRLLDRG